MKTIILLEIHQGELHMYIIETSIEKSYTRLGQCPPHEWRKECFETALNGDSQVKRSF